MQVNKVIELPEGALEVNANLSNEEVQMIMEVGLNVLLAHGTVPFLTGKTKQVHQFAPGSSEIN